MYISNISTNTLIESECPLIPIKLTLQYNIRNLIDAGGYINRSDVDKVNSHAKCSIIYATVLISSIPILIVMFISMLILIIPNNFTFMDPTHVIKLIVVLAIVFSCIPSLWLVYNHKLNNCIHLNILIKVTNSFYKNKRYTKDREKAFMHYLKLISKEWDYYDHICKLQ